MKNSVVLKSFSGGISVIMDDSLSFDELTQAVAAKFRDADSFFQDAAVAVSLEGRQLSEQEERSILDTITQNSHLNVLCLIGRDEDKNSRFLGIQNNLNMQNDENCGQFYRGSLRNGQSIETEHSIVILGDVCEGCSVYSAKDIVVLGCLAGEAYAGAAGSNDHFVAALEMNPSRLRIGDLHYTAPSRTSRWGRKPKPVPKIAYTHNGRVLAEPITKELLEGFTP